MHAGNIRAKLKLRELLGIDAYMHQAEAFAVGMNHLELYGSFALHHEQGCGKTFTLLGMIGELVEREGMIKALVVCPSSVIGSWQNEAMRAGYELECVPLVGSGAKRRDTLAATLATHTSGALLHVINYEMTWRMEDELRRAGYDIIICDEAQKLKGPGSKQSRSMHRIGRSARWRINATGTPTPESELDLYGQFRFLDERVFGTSYANFKARFAVEIPMGEFRKVIVNKWMLPELESIVHSRSHRATKADALDLPDQIDVKRPFDLSPKGRRIYEQMRRESLALLEDEFGITGVVVANNVLSRLLRLQQITGGFAQPDEDADLVEVCNAKAAVLKEELEAALESGSKVIVWHRFTREGELIAKIAAQVAGSAKNPIEQPYINGSVPSGDRREMVRRFQEDDDARIFIAQVQAASTGITLTAADTAIYYSCSFSSGEHEQARARLHRIGQEKKVRHVYLLASGTVDEHVFDALQAKRSLAESFNDSGWKRYLGG